MNIFKNKVGRPSNEILKKRKRFKIGIVLSVVILFSLFFLLGFLSTTNLKGTSYQPGSLVKLSKTPIYISAKSKLSIKRSGDFYIWSSDVSNGRIRVTKYKNKVGKKAYVAGWIKTSVINANQTADKSVVNNYLPGDVNMNGKIEASDSRLILQYIAGLNNFDANQKALADANKDGKVTAVDARLVLQIVSGSIEVPVVQVKPAIIITEYGDKWIEGESQTVTVTLGDSTDTFEARTSSSRVMSITNKNSNSFVLNAKKQGRVTITVISMKTKESITKEYTVVKGTNSTTLKAIKMGTFKNGLKIGTEGTAEVILADSKDSFTITSSNPSVMMATAIGGKKFKLKPIESGTATITVTSTKTGQTDSYTYTVPEYELPSLTRFGSKKNITLNETINGIKVYVESGCSTDNVKKFKDDIKSLAKYAAKPIKAIYIVKKNSFETANPANKNAAGLNHSGVLSYTDIMCGNYSKTTIFHESGHAMDHRYNNITGVLLSETLKSQYNTYNPWNSGDPLREYSYTTLGEFWADSYARSLGKANWKFPQALANDTQKVINKVTSVSNW